MLTPRSYSSSAKNISPNTCSIGAKADRNRLPCPASVKQIEDLTEVPLAGAEVSRAMTMRVSETKHV
jgi:hypothetical protein